ncbi:hypothetical protein A9986_05730 [Solibacillus silvestris]|nr:O-antigen polymerase [Solibacillus silvestris]OBW58435.1 hypothetical protein A9986_05730 [Solibacillus silvestris]
MLKIIIFDFITITIGCIFLIYTIVQLVKGKYNTIYIAYVGFYIFFIFPIILDLIVGYPNYYYIKNFNFEGFILSQRDNLTRLYYNIFIIIILILFMVFGKSKPITINKTEILKLKKFLKIPLTVVLVIITLIPTLLVLNFNFSLGVGFNKLLNYDYLRLLFRSSPDFLLYYYCCLFSVLSFIGLTFIYPKKIWILTLFLCIPIYISFGVHGKRNIVAIFIFLYVFVIWLNKYISKKVKISIIILAIPIFLMFTFYYQSSVRSIEGSSFNEFYTDFRIDYGRDDVVKMAIYYDLYDEDIINESGISLLYLMKFIGFDDLRTEYKYSVYATSALLGYHTAVPLGWGMTTGLWDESIANFGILFGTFIFIVIIILMCRISDYTNNIPIILLTYINVILIQVLQLTSFIFIFAIWILLLVLHFFKKLRLD